MNLTTYQSFANISDLLKKSANQRIYMELSNGYFIPVSKMDVKKVAAAMHKNGDKFCGDIIILSDRNIVQVKLK